MDRVVLHKRFQHALGLLHSLQEDHKSTHTGTSIDQFMEETVNFYLHLQIDPSLQEDQAFQNYINESALALTSLINYIALFILESETLLRAIFYGNEWIDICWRRSSLQALKDLYSHTCLAEHFTNRDIDTEDLDDYIKSVGKYEGFLPSEQIPFGMPNNHWWWWYP